MLIDADAAQLLPLDVQEETVLCVDDELARFLRSRVWVFEEARDGVLEWLRWRRSYLPMLITREDCDPYLRDAGAFFFHGFDKEGQPMCYVNLGLVHPGRGDRSQRERYCIMQMERAKRMIPFDGSRCCVVVDFAGAGIANVDRHIVLFLFHHVKRYYPDCFGTVYMVSVPFALSFIWSWLKPMLAKHAQEKARFLSSRSEMLDYVDQNWLLKEYGGEGSYDPNDEVGEGKQMMRHRQGTESQVELEPEPEPEPLCRSDAVARPDELSRVVQKQRQQRLQLQQRLQEENEPSLGRRDSGSGNHASNNNCISSFLPVHDRKAVAELLESVANLTATARQLLASLPPVQQQQQQQQAPPLSLQEVQMQRVQPRMTDARGSTTGGMYLDNTSGGRATPRWGWAVVATVVIYVALRLARYRLLMR